MLLEKLGDMICGHMGSVSHIIDALWEVENVERKNCLDAEPPAPGSEDYFKVQEQPDLVAYQRYYRSHTLES